MNRWLKELLWKVVAHELVSLAAVEEIGNSMNKVYWRILNLMKSKVVAQTDGAQLLFIRSGSWYFILDFSASKLFN